ncbi:hypothetical protein KY346_00500 [Candidatus Woesearchaeota archaeon]|nr:hypothetical protein [Candidatus Woesearchaeota archaeon]
MTEQNNREKQIEGMYLSDALKKYPKTMEIADVLESIRELIICDVPYGKRAHYNFYIRQVAPFETENFKGVVYKAENNGWSMAGTPHQNYQLSTMYFKKGERKLTELPPLEYLALTEEKLKYAELGEHSLHIKVLPQDNLEIKLIGVKSDHNDKPPYNRTFLADLKKEELVKRD